MKPATVLHLADAIVDAAGCRASGGAALLVQAGAVLAAGAREKVERHPQAAEADRRDWPGCVLLPGLVNAHVHLDLTHIGPQPYDPGGGFTGWADLIRRERACAAGEIAAAVRQGIELSRRGGTCLIGDIAGVGSLVPLEVLRESGLGGVSYVELFGQGDGQAGAIGLLEVLRGEAARAGASGWGRLGVQPHAPYSAGPALYEAAARSGLPVTTHLAETLEERRFIERGDGPLRTLIESIGKWNEAILEGERAVGRGRHPIEHLEPYLARAPWLVAHVNDLGEGEARRRHLELLARTDTSVVYCPRASDYFRRSNDFGPHAYRDMLAAGVNVALGTDSIVCLPPTEADRLSVLDEMRFLYKRDGTVPSTLLAMATLNGARALGFDPSLVTFEHGPIAGMIAVPIESECNEPMRAVLESDAPLQLI